MHDWFRLRCNQRKRQTQACVHKVNLLCFLSRCQQNSRLCNSELLQNVAFSYVPTLYHTKHPSTFWTVATVTNFLQWFRATFAVFYTLLPNISFIVGNLVSSLQSKKAGSNEELVLMFVIFLRSIGLDARTVTCLYPATFKASDLKSKNDLDEIRNEVFFELVGKGHYIPVYKKKGEASSGPSTSKDENVTVETDKNSSETGKKKRSNSSSKSHTKKKGSKSRRSKGSSRRKKNKHRKRGSSGSDDFVSSAYWSSNTNGVDHWVEVYLRSEEKWICVDCIKGRINTFGKMEKTTSKPCGYLLAVESDGCAKDVTQKYSANWMTCTRKLRVDEQWWEETMASYVPRDLIKNKSDDYQIETQMQKRPLPKSISEYKNHPLYALKRHLLKFEAIYPPDVAPVGYRRKEPVYSRECVVTLHSRETWMRDAKAVRNGEEPYKMVKARPKRNQPREKVTEPTLPVFGEWQTEEYIPPPAVDGVIPRNGYGNVELFKPCMLPAGTVHLKLPGLNKVAKKLKLDCAAAMVGWEFHKGMNLPMMDGFIVCEEHEEILTAAWEEEQAIMLQREEEKRDKRVYGNWRKLIKGLLIRERMKKKFNLIDAEKVDKQVPKARTLSSGEKDVAEETMPSNSAMHWPLNRQAEKQPEQIASIQKSDNHNDSGPLFPFEVL